MKYEVVFINENKMMEKKIVEPIEIRDVPEGKFAYFNEAPFVCNFNILKEAKDDNGGKDL